MNASYLASIKHDIDAGPTYFGTYDGTYDTLELGSWTLGTRNAYSFIMNPKGAVRPAAVVTSDYRFISGAYANAAASGNLCHTAASASVLRLGDFFFGPKSDTYFVINQVGASVPQLVISSGGTFYLSGGDFNNPAPASWALTTSDADVIRIGDWLVGQKSANHFVINRIGASLPQFLLRQDGHIWIGSNVMTPPTTLMLAPEYCVTSDEQTLASLSLDSEWLVGVKSERFVVSHAHAAYPNLVLSDSEVLWNSWVAEALPAYGLATTDSGVIAVGEWLVGVKDGAFVINTKTQAEFWPQFVALRDMTLRFAGASSQAAASYSLDGTATNKVWSVLSGTDVWAEWGEWAVWARTMMRVAYAVWVLDCHW